MRVLTPTLVAELILTSACHMVTSLILLNPELTFGALLELGSAHEVFKLLVCFRECAVDLLSFLLNLPLLTRVAFVVLNSAVHAVALGANGAVEPGWTTLFIDEHVSAIWGRTPRQIGMRLTVKLQLTIPVLLDFLLILKDRFDI